MERPRPAVPVRRVLAAALFAISFAGVAAAADDPFGRGNRVPPPRTPTVRVEGRCGDPRGISIYSFPEKPLEGGTLRFVAVAENARDAKLTVDGPGGERVASSVQRFGGPPFSWIVEVPYVSAGTYHGRLTVAGDSAACVDAEIGPDAPSGRSRTSGSMWPVERVWDRDTENLYSAWVAKLFDDSIDASPSWNSLHAVTHDPSRNFLHNSLGLGEDSEGGITLQPDCADLPYFLRGYFAWKMRLPFVYSRCYSVSLNRAPICSDTRSNLELASPGSSLAVLQRFFSRTVADTAHSATGRTAAMDDHTDVYPVRISADTLRPGAVYIDPYGHVLVVAKRVDQTPTSSGILFAVDAQPDGTVARKRYWRGTFLFALNADNSAPGFKRFRPVVPDGNSVRTLDNSEILSHPAYGDWSMEQYEGDADAFYDKVDQALSPARRSARQVMLEVVDLLQQQLEQRVASVQGGETYVAKSPGTIGMPSGAAIFQTVGAWEDYATPSRDLRLLIAIDVVRGFPEYVSHRPGRFFADRGMNPSNIRGELEALLDRELQRRTFQYQRSDGTPWTLKLSDVIERADALEMAYNPNDCVEKRWGAPEDSIEIMPCRRHAPAEQVRQMGGVREWFHTRTRPAT
ncbi:MAG TPA: hypothetical protein VN634_12185 [Candidatus Limnocylindrales bacterium]|nr:hypothetical protein [Candidatus Limnocylindrales bacterium]